MAADSQYIPPPLEGAVPSLVPVDTDARTLRPDTVVTCRHRGTRILLTQFNGDHYEIRPGLFQCRYDAARHFQARLIVPGTRQGLLGRGGSVRAESYIGILGLDPPEKCAPLDPDAAAKADAASEAYDRSTMEMPSERHVVKVKTKDVRGRVPGQAAKNYAGRQIEDQATDEARERARSVFTPPTSAAPVTEEP
jgi:hypothetical protein